MVFYFDCVDPRYVIFMGRDKYENEELLAYAFPEDIWFHVAGLSSAHVYLRTPLGQTLADVPDAVIEECSQLVKANSIQGCKLAECKVDITPFTNLRKTSRMAAGQVELVDQKLVVVRKVRRNNAIVKRITKTKHEPNVDLKQMRADRDAEALRRSKAETKARKQAEVEEQQRLRREAEERSYDRVMKPDEMMSNKELDMTVEDYEDDFM